MSTFILKTLLVCLFIFTLIYYFFFFYWIQAFVPVSRSLNILLPTWISPNQFIGLGKKSGGAPCAIWSQSKLYRFVFDVIFLSLETRLTVSLMTHLKQNTKSHSYLTAWRNLFMITSSCGVKQFYGGPGPCIFFLISTQTYACSSHIGFTAPGIPRHSPIQVQTRTVSALLPRIRWVSTRVVRLLGLRKQHKISILWR